MAWRIEQAKSDRSTCRFCSKAMAPLSVDLLRALLDSKLFGQLESLGIYQNALSPEGAELLLSRKRDLARLKALELGRESTGALQRAFRAQIDEAERRQEAEYGDEDE